MIFIWLLWLCIAFVCYVYVGFPLLLILRGLWGRPIQKRASTPTISIVIIAYNEADVIGEKLENVLSLDYPSDRLEVLVGSDGSDDGTNEIVASYADRGVVLHAAPRQGKIATLNQTVAMATGQVLVFSDANGMVLPGSLQAITSCLSDPNVGAVAGDQRYHTDSGNAVSFGERCFWSFDRFLKRMQSKAGNATSSTGALHAVRAELFQPIPGGMSDDFIISTRVISQGYRLVFEPDAVALEEVAPTDKAEFKRKSRVIARGMRGLWEMRSLLNPVKYGFYSIQLASHKLFRWSVILILPLIFLLSVLSSGYSPMSLWLVVLQTLFYSNALLVFLLRHSRLLQIKPLKLLAIPYFFCMANFASLLGWIDFFKGRKVDVWNSKRTVAADTA